MGMCNAWHNLGRWGGRGVRREGRGTETQPRQQRGSATELYRRIMLLPASIKAWVRHTPTRTGVNKNNPWRYSQNPRHGKVLWISALGSVARTGGQARGAKALVGAA